MSDQDTKFQKPDTNPEPKGLDGTERISDDFKRRQELEAKIADASPQAQQVIDELRKMESSRLEQEERNQARHHDFRVLREKDRLMQGFFSKPSPIPNDPQAKQLVYDTIADQAERTVSEREVYYRSQIPQETERNIRDVLRRDHQQATHGHQAPSHDIEHDAESR